MQQLTHFDLSYNKLNWDQKAFNEQVQTLKDKKLKHIWFQGNEFVEQVEAYRIWIISNSTPRMCRIGRAWSSRPILGTSLLAASLLAASLLAASLLGTSLLAASLLAASLLAASLLAASN